MTTIKKFIHNTVFVLSDEQKKQFNEYFPQKVFKTELGISVVVAFTQVAMIFLFLTNPNLDLSNFRTVAYLTLYSYLLVVTIITIISYSFTYKNKMFKQYTWIRRAYCFLICIWLMGITFLGQMKSSDLSVYSYMLPTMAAVLLMTPIESIVIFGSSWIMLISMLFMYGTNIGFFGTLVNSSFVTVLSILISFRYYRSMAVEFSDMKIINGQYDEIMKANNKLEKLANVDQLTGLYNRHYLHQTVYSKFDDFIKNDLHSMCLLLDIDYFKQYNDNYGHLMGDECIQRITSCIRIFCEKNDAEAIRYGGEEFLVIKVSDKVINAFEKAEELHKLINDENIIRKDLDTGYVTVSIGVWEDAIYKVNTLENAIQYADNALYKAKASGRNCIR